MGRCRIDRAPVPREDLLTSYFISKDEMSDLPKTPLRPASLPIFNNYIEAVERVHTPCDYGVFSRFQIACVALEQVSYEHPVYARSAGAAQISH